MTDNIPLEENIDLDKNTRLNSLLKFLVLTFLASGMVLVVLRQIEVYYRDQIYIATQVTLPVHKQASRSVGQNISKSDNQLISGNDLFKVCPTDWIVNKMPVIDKNQPEEYYILDGKRWEISEFDVGWVRENCDVKPQAVY